MNTRRRLTGFVISDKMDKTVIVEVTRTYRHQLYEKVVHSRRKFMVHDEKGANVGDKVVIVESRPISRHKRWVVEKILIKSQHGDDGEVLESVTEENNAEDQS
jgi:small subunit ribosomal protein S17